MTSNAKQDPKQASNPFEGLEDKSLESRQEENKTADESEAAPDAVRLDGAVIPVPPAGEGETATVEMIHHVTSQDGEALIPGEQYDLPVREAQSLVGSARAKSV